MALRKFFVGVQSGQSERYFRRHYEAGGNYVPPEIADQYIPIQFKDDCFRRYDSHSTPPAGAYPLTGRQELLNQSVHEIQNALSGNGKLKINQKIRLKVRSLSENFGLERDEIENDAVEEFLSRELYEKCNPEKTLSTFCTHFVSYSLNGQLRKEKRHRKHHQTVSLDGLAQDTHDNDWAYSDEFLEPAEDQSLADHITPEDFLHAKELLDLIIKHFGYDDAAVALGCKSRQAEAKRLNIPREPDCGVEAIGLVCADYLKIQVLQTQ